MNPAKIIYLVDDDEDDVMLMHTALKSSIHDIDIKVIKDGKELMDSISSVHHNNPALILMDMNMPKINGLEALTLLKSNEKTLHIPVIMTSTSSNPDHIKKAYALGLNAYMTKPVMMQDYTRLAQGLNFCFLNNYGSPDDSSVWQTFKGKSILIVEDNADYWELMRLTLKRSLPEVKVTRLKDRKSTLDFMTDHWNTLKPAPELIIVDLYLPTRREGLNLLDSIRYFYIIHRLPPVPVLVLSFSKQREDVDAVYQHRANSYIVKSPELLASYSYLRGLCNFWWDIIKLPKT
ncbi:response regulator [Dyadobacter sp. CY356]|uniref:response regulator n=1 Tax=Dyadobacter sp. CY356 TaxID=2906442 RepID=UPI001F26C2DC|nr:response regulator [Dyadobacter sp. CY356]MCF0055203.1 response regulator [Dyadobacter sp. CY356]